MSRFLTRSVIVALWFVAFVAAAAAVWGWAKTGDMEKGFKIAGIIIGGVVIPVAWFVFRVRTDAHYRKDDQDKQSPFERRPPAGEESPAEGGR
jgi:heme/copper-type cytochrome/quinol oxidase subunit 2